jgi:Zn-dependent protease/CBS domain-containing protein
MSEQTQSQPSKPHSSWSLPLFEVSGIPIRVHFTFILFLVWIGFGYGGMTGLVWVGFISSIFLCVLLHELGHALVAKRYGILTRHITLYPIGGVAMLEGKPKPRQELVIALAGPAVNLVIGGLLTPITLALYGKIDLTTDLSTRGGFLSAVLVANLTLAIFNLVPAYPMDGGRVLRAVLGLHRSEQSATRIAAGVGQALAIGLGFVAAISGSVILFIVAAFVFLGAGQELTASVTRSFLEGHTVTDAMQIQFRTIESGATMDQAAHMLIEGSQHDFPVVIGDEVLGVLTRNAIAKGLAVDGSTGFVAGAMNRDFKRAEPTMPLEEAVDLFSDGDSSPILIMSGDELLGMLTAENLSEFIMLEHARARPRRV